MAINDLPDEILVTVCSACLRASCWHGAFPCEDAKGAGTVIYTVAELRPLNLEHESYWKPGKGVIRP